MPRQRKVEAPVEHTDEALAAMGGESMGPEEFGLRAAAKRDAAMQDAGWITSPQNEADMEPISDGDVIEQREPLLPPPPEEEAEEEEELEAEEAETLPTEQEIEDFYLGRYRTREAAEEGLAEKDRTIDRLFRELHARGGESEPQPGEQGIDVGAWHEWAAEAVEGGAGAAGAIEAIRTGGPDGYAVYLQHWLSEPDQTAEAMLFNNDYQQQMAAMVARQAAAPLLAERAARDAKIEGDQAKQMVEAQIPDFAEYEADINQLLTEDTGLIPADTMAWLTDLATNHGLQGKVTAWQNLYIVARSARAPARKRAQQTERAARRQSGDAARVAATVSTAEGSATRTPMTARQRTETEIRNSLRREWGMPEIPTD